MGETTRALAFAQQAAGQGDVQAQILAGHLLRSGEAGLTDMVNAVNWYRLAAAQNHPDGLVALADMALRRQGGLQPQAARTWLEQAAHMGRTDAMRVLAELYLKGLANIDTNRQTAIDWLMKAHATGDKAAARALGDIFIDESVTQALHWYERGAAQGDANAAYQAAILQSERDDPVGDKKTVTLMRQAAEAGIAAAAADYGLLLFQGKGVDKDRVQAANWFARAAVRGDKEGQFLYAFVLARGEGVELSFGQAYYWLLKSGHSEISAYETDRHKLKTYLETYVQPEILQKAKDKWQAEQAEADRFKSE